MSNHKRGNGHKRTSQKPLVDLDTGSSKREIDHKETNRLNGHTFHGEENGQPQTGTARSEPGPSTTKTHSISASTARRVRINRIVMRKHRHARLVRAASPRLLPVALILFTLFIVFASSGAGAAYAYYQAQLPLLNGIAQHSLFQTTHIYDRNGKLLYSVYDHSRDDRGRRTYVNYSDIAPTLVNATIAAEDHTFWTNSGVDYYGIVRAAVSDMQSQSVVEGASTITQQLIKKQLFPNDPRTVQIKGEEALLATGLTQQYPKWKIMEMYLNTVFYGNSDYGVEAAAQDYFGLQPQCVQNYCRPAVSQLDLAQAALLAGLPQSPTSYQPIVYKDKALERQKLVLQSMVDLSMITRQQMNAAHDEMARYTFISHSDKQPMLAPHFVNYLINQVLIPLLGARSLYDGGYNIYTTLDLGLEQQVEQIVYGHLYQLQQDSYLGPYGPLNVTNNVNDGAAVVMDPINGEILAMDGSADYSDTTATMQGQYNAAATLPGRPPGSSFKPIVYATAFEMGWYPAMIIPDHQTYFPYPTDNKPYYAPQNYDQTFHTGFPMTVREAIANSYNIPALDAMEFAGHANVLNMAGRLGLPEIANTPLKNVGPALAIGSNSVSLLHLTGAYATFANQGVRVPTTSILQITDNQGKSIYTYDSAHPQGIRAMGADVAYLMSSILSDKQARYHEFFPGNPLEMSFPAAAKTGTTDSFRDNWTMGYTPHLAVGVWAGNSDNSPMHNVIGITGAGPIWHDIMQVATQRYHFAPDNFVKPPDVQRNTVSAFTGLLPHPGEPTVSDWFINGTMPTIQGPVFYSPPPVCMGEGCLQQEPKNQNNPGGQPGFPGNDQNNPGGQTGFPGNDQNNPGGQPGAPGNDQNNPGGQTGFPGNDQNNPPLYPSPPPYPGGQGNPIYPGLHN